MCLIALAWRADPSFPLIVAANRDEFHGRPTAPAAFWQDRPAILAGRDLEALGTWMGVSRSGRFAAVTNYRGGRDPLAAESRGALVTRFLDGNASPGEYVRSIDGGRYSGFNLLVADDRELWWLSNRDGGARRLEPGVYGLANLLLDSPDVEDTKRRLGATAPAIDALFGILQGVRIVNPQYGTRCSTILLRENGRVRYAERAFDAQGAEGETLRYEFPLAA
jgi:uncharacterized protein with NRDE domain